MRFARGILRLAFALVFGFTSLAHGPAMTLRAAAAGLPCHDAGPGDHAAAHAAMHDATIHDATAHGAMSHHPLAANAAADPQPSDSQGGGQKVCPMPGCFLMIAPAQPAERLPAIAASRYESVLMPFPGALAPDPADPPPRLPA